MTNQALITAITLVLIGIFSVMLLEQQDYSPFDAAVDTANEVYDTRHDEASDLTTN